MNVLPQGFLNKISVYADTPSKIQSVGGGERRGSFDSGLEGLHTEQHGDIPKCPELRRIR